MVKFLGMEWAPLHVPFERRLQTFGAMNYIFFVFLMQVFVAWWFYYLLFNGYALLVATYGVWWWWDWQSPKRGAYGVSFIRNLAVHRWFANYFPIKLHTTAELPAEKNYLIGYHPHGIMTFSALSNFMSNGTGLMDRYPNINFHICTLEEREKIFLSVGNFYFPIRREWMLVHGTIDCSKESLRYVLGGPRNGQAATLVVGGAEEALDAHPGQYVLTLSKRKGFVKMALQTGAQLVPCFAFGENDMFLQTSNEEGSLTRSIQMFMKKTMGVSFPLFYGRGILNYSFGFLPLRKEINTVLGAPIAVEKCENPIDEQINTLHALYVEKLTELFETHKERFGVEKDNNLIIH